jgi:hypothetical protein
MKTDDGFGGYMNARRKRDERESAQLAGSPAERSLDQGVEDPRRRRLVKGAAVLAPAVLTLRSGALLAASSICPGQVMMTATVNNDENRTLVGIDQRYDFSSSQSTGHCYERVSSDAACDRDHTSDVGRPYGILQATVEDDSTGIVYTCSGDPPENTPIVVITQSSVISLV